MKTARDKVLLRGLVDWVDLGRIHATVKDEHPDASLSELQDQSLSLIRSLVSDGQFVFGSVRRNKGFEAWDTSLDESMRRIRDMYVSHFDDEGSWAWGVWLKLTPNGRRVARRVEGVGIARDDVLLDGLSEIVDLGSVHWYVWQDNFEAPLSTVQSETLSLVRSLLSEGLVDVGDFSDKSGDFVAWDTPVEASMQRIYKLYVTYYRDTLGWPYEVWLELTEKGERIARSLEAKRRDSLG